MMNLYQEVAPALLLVGIMLAVLGAGGELVVNAGHWRDARKDEESRLSDLSGRTRFTWRKKRRHYSRRPQATPPDRPRCVLPPRRP